MLHDQVFSLTQDSDRFDTWRPHGAYHGFAHGALDAHAVGSSALAVVRHVPPRLQRHPRLRVFGRRSSHLGSAGKFTTEGRTAALTSQVRFVVIVFCSRAVEVKCGSLRAATSSLLSPFIRPIKCSLLLRPMRYTSGIGRTINPLPSAKLPICTRKFGEHSPPLCTFLTTKFVQADTIVCLCTFGPSDTKCSR